jgi:WD40 repeat protein
MHYYRDLGRILVIQDHCEDIVIIKEDFKLIARVHRRDIFDDDVLRHQKRKQHGKLSSKAIVCCIHDAIYIPCDGDLLLAFCAEDYTISIVKERKISDSRHMFKMQNLIMHNLIHTQLSWSASSRVLCSIASNHLIYGWRLDESIPLFQVTRHKDVITGFLSVDESDMFVTCSMDKRIVMWSAYNQRVKGILEGHTRGVRCIHASSRFLISGSFDCDARVWEFSSRECKTILRGHRMSIVAVRLMFEQMVTESDMRAFTVDESGEIRFWIALFYEKLVLAPVVNYYTPHHY